MNISAALTIVKITKQITAAQNALLIAEGQVVRYTRLLAQGHHDHSATAPFNAALMAEHLAGFQKTVAAKTRLIAKKQAEVAALAA